MLEEEKTAEISSHQAPSPDKKRGFFRKFTKAGARISAAMGLAGLGITGLAANAQARTLEDATGVTANDPLNAEVNYATPDTTTNVTVSSPSPDSIAQPIPSPTASLEAPQQSTQAPTPSAEVKPSAAPAAPSLAPSQPKPAGVVGIDGTDQKGEALYSLAAQPAFGSGFSIVFNHDTGKFTVTVRGSTANLDSFLAAKGLSESDLPLAAPIKIVPTPISAPPKK